LGRAADAFVRPDPQLTPGRIFRFWAPLAATWLMMAVEGPFIAAIIARLPAPAENLAAFGIAYAAAVIVESPVIMLLSASTALVRDRSSFVGLRRFAYALNGLLTLFIVAAQAPAVSAWFFRGLLGLPSDVADLTVRAFPFLIPWPAAIGYRRFYQGLLIRRGLTRWVGFGTMFRLVSMGVAAVLLSRVPGLGGASVGTMALSAGVLAEAIVSRLLSREIVQSLLSDRPLDWRATTTPALDAPPAGVDDANAVAQIHPAASEHDLTLRSIVYFYGPLATTSMLAMAVQPTITFFMGSSHRALESLAVLPVVNGLTFLFRSLAVSYHEAIIALLGDRYEHYPALRSFAGALMLFTSVSLTLIGFTPLSSIVLEGVAGLPGELAAFALRPARILALLPAFTVWMSVQRGVLVLARRTTVVTWSTVVEVSVIVTILWVGIARLDLTGAVAAALALMIGRLAGTLTLMGPAAAVLRARGV
jgi:hypothetical protein